MSDLAKLEHTIALAGPPFYALIAAPIDFPRPVHVCNGHNYYRAIIKIVRTLRTRTAEYRGGSRTDEDVVTCP
jgi:hypothetical protein